MKLLLTLLLGLACIDGFLVNESVQAFNSSSFAQKPTPTVPSNPLPKPPEDSIRDTAQLITVRVLSVDRQEWENSGLGTISISGSGILVDRKEVKQNQNSVYFYLVLTNAHILPRPSSEIAYIKTHDGLIHHASLHPSATFGTTDLGLLWFYSPYRYEKAVLGQSLNRGSNTEQVFVAGFLCPLTSILISCPANFTFTKGTGFFIDKPLADGYQIAYTNETQEGTSGGPVLDVQGKVIGINGRGKTPAEAPQNKYSDDSGIPEIIQKQSPLALGLPIESYVNLASSKNLLDNLPAPANKVVLFQPTQKLNHNLNTSRSNNFISSNLSQIWLTLYLFVGLITLILIDLILFVVLIILLLWLIRWVNEKPKPKLPPNNPEQSNH
ncbi:MAG: trypsin-like peptidase domain-containing protein [Symploca sp. SIO2G7]|nr:trypsin-like peptidase domain-containing protein [Symploca sp. SIO2G7]